MAKLQIAEGTMTNTRIPTPATRDLVLTRELNAPRKLVFEHHVLGRANGM